MIPQEDGRDHASQYSHRNCRTIPAISISRRLQAGSKITKKASLSHWQLTTHKYTGIEMDNRRRRTQGQPRTDVWPEKMKLSLAHKFLGVSHAKITSLVKEGIIPHEQDPLDHRIKLVRKSDLEKFKHEW